MYTRLCRYSVILLATVGIAYGINRAYYAVTDGFAIDHIYSDTALALSVELRPPTNIEQNVALRALQQPFTYLGKGCQSYVFASQNGDYVLKFIKHQRFRTKPWLDALTFIPWLASYQKARQAHKSAKYAQLIIGWQTAYNHLAEQTGVVCVHLHTTANDGPWITLHDKLGQKHQVNLGYCEYLLQRRTELFLPTLQALLDEGADAEAQVLLDRLIALILNTYRSGFIDGDHAIMQNTGICNGYPLQIDVGQLHCDPSSSDPIVYKQGLFNKMYRLRLWLQERNPALKQYLDAQLFTILGEELYTLKPHIDV